MRSADGKGCHDNSQTLAQKELLLVICQVLWYNASASGGVRGLFIWGCRVSTGEQIVELQVEVSVRTLVKQPTKQ